MMLLKQVVATFVLAATAAFAQGGAPAQKDAKPATTPAVSAAKSAAPSAERVVARPKSFDLDAMDKTANPCEDFYEYTCGNWRKKNPIPSDEARWGRFNELAEYNRQTLHQILEKDSANNPKRTPVQQK